MEILLIAPILIFLFTLLVPAFASQDDKSLLARRTRAAQGAEEQARLDVRVLEVQQQRLKEINASLNDQLAISDELTRKRLEHAIAEDKVALAIDSGNKKALKGLAKLTTELKNLTKEQDNANLVAEGFISNLQGMLGVSDDLSGGFLGLATSGLDFQKVLDRVSGQMGKAFSGAKLLDSVYTKLKQSTMAVAMAQDAAYSSFVRATGAMAGAYTQTITEAFHNTRQLGVTMGEAGAATGSLYSEMVGFTRINSHMRQVLVDTVALMAEFGIATSTSSQVLNTLTTVMGMSAREARNVTKSLVDTAESIGIPTQRLLQDLNAAAPQLAQWGDEMVDVFLDLQRASKATGASMQSLLGVAKQFDTFYGAAEAVGQLQQLLGGPYLNAVEMVYMNEEERIEQLVRMMDASDKSWESMGRLTRQAVANAAGITDMSLAAQIFGQSLEEYRANTAAAAAETRTLAERAAEAQMIHEKFAAAMQSFAITLRPLVEALGVLAGWLAFIGDVITEQPILKFFATIALTAGVIATPVIGLAMAFQYLGFSVAATLGPIGFAIAGLSVLAAIFTIGHSPTFPEYVGITAENLNALTTSARRAKSAVRDLNPHLGAMKTSVMGVVTAKVTNTEERTMFSKMMKSNEEYVRRLEAVANRDIVLKLKDREFGRATGRYLEKNMLT